jgi:hypothetical protein
MYAFFNRPNDKRRNDPRLVAAMVRSEMGVSVRAEVEADIVGTAGI